MNPADRKSIPSLRGISLVLVDDHRLMREGIRRILQTQPDLNIVGETDDGHEALALIRQHGVRVAILDLNMPGLAGFNLIRRIRHDHPGCAVLVLSMHAEEQYAMRSLKAGALGYLTKDAAAEELVLAVRKVAAGDCYLSRRMAENVALALVRADDTPRHELLSDREMEIFGLIVAGKRMTEISEALHLSIKTVSTHKARILQKMHLPGTAALIRYGLQNRLFPDSEATGDAHDQALLPDLASEMVGTRAQDRPSAFEHESEPEPESDPPTPAALKAASGQDSHRQQVLVF